MINNKNDNPSYYKMAAEIELKYEFYFVSLIFTLLALSIQTASFTDINVQCVMEIIGWFILMMSGIFGLSRLEWLSVLYHNYGSLSIGKHNLNTIEQGIQGKIIVNKNDEEWHIEKLRDEKTSMELNLETHSGVISKQEKNLKLTYLLRKWGFVIGLLCIMSSRILIALTKIIN